MSNKNLNLNLNKLKPNHLKTPAFFYNKEENYENMGILAEEDEENLNSSNPTPAEEDIIDYAKYIGLNPDLDKSLMYIAEQGINAPVPKPWKACKDDSDYIFYHNSQTNEKTYEHPLDEHFRQVVIQEKKKRENIKKNNNNAINNNSGINNSSSLIKSNKKIDPLLQVQYEKKLTAFRNEQNLAFERKCLEIDREISSQILQIESNHQQNILKIERDILEKQREQETNLMSSLKNYRIQDLFSKELKDFEKNLIDQKRKELEIFLQKEKENKDVQLSMLENKLALENKELIKKKKEILLNRQKEVLENLEREEKEIEKALYSHSNYDEREIKSEIAKNYRKEKEKALEIEKSKIRNKIQKEFEILQQEELISHEKRMDNLNSKSKEKNTFNEREYTENLEEEFRMQELEIRKELEKKFELKKLQTMEKIAEYEKNLKNEMEERLKREMKKIDEQEKKQREKIEEDFLREKDVVENTVKSNFVDSKANLENALETLVANISFSGKESEQLGEEFLFLNQKYEENVLKNEKLQLELSEVKNQIAQIKNEKNSDFKAKVAASFDKQSSLERIQTLEDDLKELKSYIYHY